MQPLRTLNSCAESGLLLRNEKNCLVGMKKLCLIVVLVALTACQQEPSINDGGLAGFDTSRGENQKQACLDRGGRYAQGGLSGTFVCYEDTKDANKACTKSTQCEGYCLARSNTCTPIVPLIGCHEVLNSVGARSTVCLE